GSGARYKTSCALALLLLAAYDVQSIRGRGIFSVFGHGQYWRLDGGCGGVATGLGVASGIGGAGCDYLFHFVCAAVPARTASIPGRCREDACAPRMAAHAGSLFDLGNTFHHGRGAKSGKPDINSDLRGSRLIRRALRLGLDGKPAPWPTHPEHRIADA